MYRLTSDNDVVVREDDETLIPRGHRLWDEYEQWLAAGGAPNAIATPDFLAANENALWQAAHDYEYAQISGSAIGLLALGVLSGKPKALAVQEWVRRLWMDEYYPRKAALPADAVVGSAVLDFSVVGPIPHTVPELTAEMNM